MLEDTAEVAYRYLEKSEEMNELAARVLHIYTKGRACGVIQWEKWNGHWSREEKSMLDVASAVHGMERSKEIMKRQWLPGQKANEIMNQIKRKLGKSNLEVYEGFKLRLSTVWDMEIPTWSLQERESSKSWCQKDWGK